MIHFKRNNQAYSAAMPFIMLTVLIDMISIGLIIPVLPLLVGHFTHSQTEQVFWYGAISFVFGLANFLGSPILGALSDQYGRRPVLLLGFCGLALNFFFTALATSIWMLIIIRLMGGAMQANAAVCNAYVADITAPEQRAQRFGMIGAMFGVGFIIGPVVGGLLGAINLHLPFIVAGSLALINLIYGYFILPESLPVTQRRAFSWASANPFTALHALTRLKTIGPLIAVIACNGLAQFTLYSIWVLYTTFKFGWGPLENGQSLAAVGIMSVIVQGVLLGPLLRRFSPRQLAVIGLLSSSVAYFLWGVANHAWMMYAVIFTNIFGVTVNATIQSIISTAVDAHNQGQALGAVSSLNSLTAVIAPIIGAPLLAAVSHLPHNDWRIGTPFYFCAILQSIALLLAFLHFRHQRN